MSISAIKAELSSDSLLFNLRNSENKLGFEMSTPTQYSVFLSLFFFSNLIFFNICESFDDFNSLYLSSPKIFFPNYQKMLLKFKIYVYTSQNPSYSLSPIESLFYNSLQNSQFVTIEPNEAHLFFVPFISSLSTRSISRAIKDLQMEFPYWNRTLGADHFYFSCAGIGYESDRLLVELKKNSVQLSCFPSVAGKFIPHKDITLPPLAGVFGQRSENGSLRSLYYVGNNAVKNSNLIEEFVTDPDFLFDSGPPESMAAYTEKLSNSRFCLFEYGADMSGIGVSMLFGCVPVVITDGPIQDLPLMELIKWPELVVFVRSSGGEGITEVKRVLDRRTCDDGCEERRRLGMAASTHLSWHEKPQPYDAFHMVMYQLWLRRHTIRYARSDI